jgi:hypothetical protein
MIIRQSFRAHLHPENRGKTSAFVPSLLAAAQSLVAEGRLLTTSLFIDGLDLFWYSESRDTALLPSELLTPLAPLLDTWPGTPGPRLWIPLVEVFHFCEPESEEQWARKQPVTKRVGKIALLRPERVASYIYFHYQLQEERAFQGEKYKYICLHENLLFQYDELPAVMESPSAPGRLATHGTPTDWPSTRMDLHFIPWDEKTRFFRPIETVFDL